MVNCVALGQHNRAVEQQISKIESICNTFIHSNGGVNFDNNKLTVINCDEKLYTNESHTDTIDVNYKDIVFAQYGSVTYEGNLLNPKTTIKSLYVTTKNDAVSTKFGKSNVFVISMNEDITDDIIIDLIRSFQTLVNESGGYYIQNMQPNTLNKINLGQLNNWK